jgi:hypothetical protein
MNDTTNISELRARLGAVSDAKLEQMTRDESLRQVERDVAGDMLREREQLEATKQGVARREERRQAARATVDDASWPETLPAVLGHPGGSQAMTKNQAAAESFAGILQRVGLPAKARRTQKVNGRDVVDGWTVNVRDAEAEVGYVAVWYGRGHFLAYVEITGHRDRTDETAAMFAAFQQQLGGDDDKAA